MSEQKTKTPQTPIGVMSFPHLFKPRPPAPGAEPRYSVNLIFDKAAQASPAYKAMKLAALQAARDKFGAGADEMIKRGAIRMPFRPVSEKSQFAGYDAPEGVFVNFWTLKQPGVVDGRLQDVLPADLYPGCLGRVSYNAFGYANSGNRGVSFGLNNVQVSDMTTPRLDGRASAHAEFDALDEDMGAGPGAELEQDEIPF